MYLSIDFEDFNHDLKRSLGIWETGPLKPNLLWEKYNIINEIYKKNKSKEGKSGTFFCTGIIALNEPSLIKRISDDGHEIACHYNYHDVMNGKSDYEIENNLVKAKESLESASGQTIHGFRAPYFAIDKQNPKQYKLLEKYFTYDSSFICTTKKEVEIFRKQMNLKNLKILPIFQHKFAKLNCRLGGSYLKLFPYFYTNWMVNMSLENGFIPHIYLHPYEFGNSEKFQVSKNELKVLGRWKANFWYLRQKQWLKFRNDTLKFKLENLMSFNNLDGTLYNLSSLIN